MEDSSLKTLIDELKKNKKKGIQDLISQKKEEQFFVDFKTTSVDDYTDKKALDHRDKANLAKAISGFGNSEGGILIWGVDTTSCSGSDDYAQALKPIGNPENFSSCINSGISRLTVPAHEKVENFIIKEQGNSKGFVVTIIPKSNNAPHQIIDGYKYYMRAGDSFLPVPHAVLVGMFGRRPSPDVIIMFTVSDTDKKNDNTEDGIKFSFGIHLVNRGMGIARDIYLNYYIFGVTDNIELVNEITDKRFEGARVFGIGANLMASKDFRMANEQRAQPVTFSWKVKPPFEKDITIQISAGAEGQPPARFEKKITKEKLKELHDNFIDNPNFNFASKFLDVENITDKK